jgi:hypothetical protein
MGKDIKNEALVLPPDITASKAEIAHGVFKGSELMRKVLQLVYTVNPENVSKVVDENGEPLVVYHDTNSKRYVNVETGEDWNDLDAFARAEWDNRDDWDDHWVEQDFTTNATAQD